MEFLVSLELDVHAVPDGSLDRLAAEERKLATSWREDGTIVRMWRLPGRRATVSVWNVADADALHGCLSALPLWPWMTVEVAPLARHYVED